MFAAIRIEGAVKTLDISSLHVQILQMGNRKWNEPNIVGKTNDVIAQVPLQQIELKFYRRL